MPRPLVSLVTLATHMVIVLKHARLPLKALLSPFLAFCVQQGSASKQVNQRSVSRCSP